MPGALCPSAPCGILQYLGTYITNNGRRGNFYIAVNHFTLITNTITVKGREVLDKPTTCTKADLEVELSAVVRVDTWQLKLRA